MKKLILTLAIIMSSLAAQAETLNNVDITPAVTYFKQYVHALTQPIYIYNWSMSNDPNYQKVTDAHAPFAVKLAARSATSFWINFGHDTGGNMYGFGLYAAVDPQATKSFGGIGYGGDQNNWILYQLHAPVGFKMIDLVHDHMTPPQEVHDILTRFNCTVNDYSGFDPFEPSGISDPACVSLITKIFKDDLQIDAFLYGYQGTDYSSCVGTPLSDDRHGAFVITNNRWINAQSVEIFTPATRNDMSERILLESLINSNSGFNNYGYTNGDESDAFKWADLQREPLLSDAVIGHWANANLLGCSFKIPYTDSTPH